MTLADGLYDLLLTEDLTRTLSALAPGRAVIRPLDGDAVERFAELVARQLAAMLSDMAGADDERARRQLALVNALLVELRQSVAHVTPSDKPRRFARCRGRTARWCNRYS